MAKHPLLFLLIILLHHFRCQSQDYSKGFTLELIRRQIHDVVLPATIRPPITRSSYLFTIDATIGTPSRKRTFIFDTGSSLIWTQCKPCLHCFKQDYPLFDPKTSSSYRKLPPNHALARFFRRSNNNDLAFNVTYESGQSSAGVAALETLTFPSSRNGRESLNGAVFGCTNDHRGQFTSNTMVTGIMGMNSSPLSLVGQIGPKSVRRFSYCLLPLSPSVKSTFLRFGNDVTMRGSFQKTGFLSMGGDYSVRVVGISVSGRRLSLPRGAFSKGCVVDVGSAASMLEMEAYTPMLNELTRHFDWFNLARIRNTSSSEGDLCYRLKPGFRDYPSMTLHLQGANLEVGPENLFRLLNDRFCLALFGSRHLTLLGAHQQQNLRLVYDVGNENLLFAKEDCSRDGA